MYKYSQGDYMRRRVGDYYASRGDPGLLSGVGKFLGKAVKTLAPIAGIIPGGGIISKVIGTVGKIASKVKRIPGAGAIGTGVAIGAGAAAAERAVQSAMNGGMPGRSRRINPLNPKALRRSTRRLAMFRGHATRALRELGYTVHRSGTARATRKRKVC